jgi:hypothetical protein
VRWRAVGGVAGPAAFVTAWSILGARRAGYSPVHDPISRLAEVGSSTRPGMTGGFLAFGLGVAVYSTALRPRLPGASIAAATTAVATVGVAAFPLGAAMGDGPHAAAAGIAYASLVAIPALGARTLGGQGQRAAARMSATIAAAAGSALVASTLSSSHTGLFQRLGLTIADVWIVGSAVWLLRERRQA